MEPTTPSTCRKKVINGTPFVPRRMKPFRPKDIPRRMEQGEWNPPCPPMEPTTSSQGEWNKEKRRMKPLRPKENGNGTHYDLQWNPPLRPKENETHYALQWNPPLRPKENGTHHVPRRMKPTTPHALYIHKES
ncbi:hypothetical protein AMTR_s02611p00001130 [Amborella trichopoda]|uniref:Uncharacterized protein n=1 Tax=Amborella trichopoda TaxID=13333 RepID=U5CLX4_AMBTC|nr:hypothetical protein AMTR_s02611p00001130 [Amborella trichopoda]